MHIYVSPNQADAYLCGLLSRLQLIDDPDESVPKLPLGDRRAILNKILWITVGGSGENILTKITNLLRQEFRDIALLESLNVAINHEKKWAKFRIPNTSNSTDVQNKLREFPNRHIVIVDDAVRTGLSMKLAHELACRYKAKNITSYALGIKCGSCYIPSYFSMMANDADHVYIQRKYIFVRQIITDHYNSSSECIYKYENNWHQHLRDMPENPKIAKKRFVATNKMMPQQQTQNCRKYVCTVAEKLEAFVVFELVPRQSNCMVHELCQFDINSSPNAALSLMRFIEVYARHHQCQFIAMAGTTTNMAVHLFKQDGYVHENGQLYKKLY